MAGLFDKQANFYAAARPIYPPSVFSFLASLTPHHDRAWDVGAGSGQATLAVAKHYEKVIATDVSEKQLAYAPKKENITYACTPALMSEEELHSIVGEEGSVDLVTVAQAVHWFDRDSFYEQVKHVLRKPGGIFAAWCYTEPTVNDAVDGVYWKLYKKSKTYWAPARLIVDNEYRSLEFPFQSVLDDGRGTGPVEFEITKQMRVEEYLMLLKSSSVVQSARSRGVELLDDKLQTDFRTAWGSTEEVRTVSWPIFMRVGTVPASDS